MQGVQQIPIQLKKERREYKALEHGYTVKEEMVDSRQILHCLFIGANSIRVKGCQQVVGISLTIE